MNKIKVLRAREVLEPLKITIKTEDFKNNTSEDKHALWCPNDCANVPPVVGEVLCPCGVVVKVSKEHVNWFNGKEE